MLLTSGQVSVAVTSAIVFLCTAALFLSGYVLQQRTLRDLRAAVKPAPRPSPKIFLPDRFKQSTTELADGTVIALDDEATHTGDVTIEVKPTLPDEAGARHSDPDRDANARAAKAHTKEQPTKTEKGQGKKSSSNKKDTKGKGSPADGGSDSLPQKPLSRAERRRRIKEEIMKLSQGEERGYYQRRLW